jgi:hypothetical protein
MKAAGLLLSHTTLLVMCLIPFSTLHMLYKHGLKKSQVCCSTGVTLRK